MVGDVEIFSILLLSLGIALVLTGPMLWLTRRVGLLDMPGREPHKQHQEAIPLAGGLILIATVVIGSLIYGFAVAWQDVLFLVALVLVCGFGAWDDWKAMRPRWKLVGQILAAGLMIAAGVQVTIFASQAVNLIITMIWLVGITNAFNFVDSMDGLATGLGVLTLTCFMLVSNAAGQYSLTSISAVGLGGLIAVYYFNARPARLFLGDSGSQLIGLLLGALAVEYNPVGYTPLTSWFTPILILAVPLFDTLLVIISRARRGVPVYQSNLDHTYHRLVAIGMNTNRATLTIHMAAFLLDCLAFMAIKLPPVLANVVYSAAVLAGLIVIGYLDSAPQMRRLKARWQRTTGGQTPAP
ncbi:MAG TPA: MraY family glycosyltransferase [Anaerolineaceae bacterium]|nr:MraY family glycosyltransferase [Anaerolineaceae bacterium]